MEYSMCSNFSDFIKLQWLGRNILLATTHKKWLNGFIKLTGGILIPSTYERIISIIDSNELNNICVDFVFRLIKISINLNYDFYYFDGKVDKSSGGKLTPKMK